MKRAPPLDWEVVLDRLSAFYGRGDWRVPYLRDHAEDPFQVLIGTILSQRTRDENTDRASAKLFAKYPDAAGLARATPKAIEALIRETGFYRTKARHIRACAQQVLERFHGVVPPDLDTLLTLPGVGPKTANCVLVFGYGIPGVPVDTHVHRISNRIGAVRTKTPEETEAQLRERLPREYWIPINPLLVQHGQNLCRPNGPLCERCPIADICPTGVARTLGRPTPRPEDRVARGASAARQGRRRPPSARRPTRGARSSPRKSSASAP
ncbi:MAG: endonuclease III [Thermoplasmata archaeon]|nr:endonuclease III [Thermoplasmata archaeon]